MRALEDDRYVRQTEGYLPKANVAFVDEIFKANSAILNTLLTVLNERLFDNGTKRELVPLLCLVKLRTLLFCSSCKLPLHEHCLHAFLMLYQLCTVAQTARADAVSALHCCTNGKH